MIKIDKKLFQVKWSAYKKVPILVVETPEGESIQLVDSSMIISTLYSFLLDKSKGKYQKQ